MTDQTGLRAANPAHYTIELGVFNTTQAAPMKIGVSKIIIHPSYDNSAHKYDIALVKLAVNALKTHANF